MDEKDFDEEDIAHLEVKVWSGKFTKYNATALQKKESVALLICGREITDSAKRVLEKAGIDYRENIDIERYLRERERE